MTKQRVANMFAYTSLVCSLSVWLALGLYLLQSSLDATLPGSQWLLRQAGEFWLLVEAVGLVLAIVATALRSKTPVDNPRRTNSDGPVPHIRQGNLVFGTFIRLYRFAD
jgi:hypothetical protein